jgi:hypothetical protein
MRQHVFMPNRATLRIQIDETVGNFTSNGHFVKSDVPICGLVDFPIGLPSQKRKQSSPCELLITSATRILAGINTPASNGKDERRGTHLPSRSVD